MEALAKAVRKVEFRLLHLKGVNYSSMPERCEVVEVRNLADAVGYSCSRTASTQCSDCGIELCEPHTETCGTCRSVFCPSCFSFHQTQHSKRVSTAHGEDRERKSA